MCKLIFLQFAEKIQAIFWELPSIQKQMHIFCGYVVVLDRPASDLYITYSVYYGTIKKTSKCSILKGETATT